MAFVTLTRADIERLLPMRDCIEVMAEALVALERGELTQPLRGRFMPAQAHGFMTWMPAHRSGEQPIFGLKLLCVMEGNPARGLPAIQGAVLLMDGVTGQLRAVMDAAAITSLRTAAVSSVATRLLARDDASELAIIGTGVQGARHLEALPHVRPIRRARVADLNLELAQAFARRVQPNCSFPIEAAATAEAAVREADIIVTTTTSAEPVLRRAWLKPGVHINAIGASRPTLRELDTATVAAASLFTDRRQSLEGEAGEYQLALKDGAIKPGHVKGELGELLVGKVPGRTSPDEITLFRALGLAIEDTATAHRLLQEATRQGIGTTVAF
ncbi:MAG: ornithine cyclodeaminase family protein [Chloroflexi bacterium]|nr:ornithine cyclodeaminase family protein [Chloroflexota bacterium]